MGSGLKNSLILVSGRWAGSLAGGWRAGKLAVAWRADGVPVSWRWAGSLAGGWRAGKLAVGWWADGVPMVRVASRLAGSLSMGLPAPLLRFGQMLRFGQIWPNVYTLLVI